MKAVIIIIAFQRSLLIISCNKRFFTSSTCKMGKQNRYNDSLSKCNETSFFIAHAISWNWSNAYKALTVKTFQRGRFNVQLNQPWHDVSLYTCSTFHRYPIFSKRYSVLCKVYTGYCGTSEIEHGLCACTADNLLAKARGLSLRTGAQTMLYLPLINYTPFELYVFWPFVQTDVFWIRITIL